jgi:dolichol-phosphate mannosyltransferase
MSDVSCPPDPPSPSFSPDGGTEAPRQSGFDRFIYGLPSWLRQFIKFAIVGGSGTLINLGVFSLIIFVYAKAATTRPLLVEQVASGIAFCAAVVSNYYFNRRWTFRHSGPVIAHFGRFFLVSCLGLVLNVFFYTALHSWAGLGEHLSELLAIACVMPVNFLGSKFWAFR